MAMVLLFCIIYIFQTEVLCLLNISEILKYIYIYLFYWIYWGEISSQNHTCFKCTTQKNFLCTLHRAPIAQSKVSFHPNFPPFDHLHLPLTPLWLSPCFCQCLCIIYTCIWFFAYFSSFIWYPNRPPCQQTAVSLFHVSKLLILFCLSVYFVH